MSITKNAGRQGVVVAYVDISFADLVDDVAQGAIDLPLGAVVVGGEVIVTEAFDSGTTDELSVGLPGDSNIFVGGIDGQALGLTTIEPFGAVHDATNNSVEVTWLSSGSAATAGAFRLAVRYYVNGRASASQG